MEIRLKCNDKLELNGFKSLKTISLNILSYNLIKDTLKGDVMIEGEYLKDNEETPRWYEQITPFTIVFRNEDIKINEIELEELNYNIIDNQFIDLSFEIVVEYDLHNKYKDDDDIEVPVEVVEEEMVFNEIKEIETEEDEITKHYDDLLESIFNSTNDRSSNIELNIKEEKTNFKNQKTSYKTITVFYLKNENEMENISKERRISVQDLYKRNDDFQSTKRLIIND